MRPSNPGGSGIPTYSSHPAPGHLQQQFNSNQAQFFTSRGTPQVPKGQNLKYYPSLSGSETDCSTSTENLTQEERYVLRNMERQEPQGEENHHPGPHYGSNYQGFAGGPAYHPPPPYNDRLVAQQLASNNARREALRLDAMIAASRQGTPVGNPSPSINRMNTEDLYAAVRMSAASRQTHQTNPKPTVAYHQALTPNVTLTQEQNLSRLAPSVYSHPNVQDPILKSPKSFYQDPSVLIPNKGFNISTSGAYFDTSAVSTKQNNDLQTQNDMIAQLTREMKLSGALSGGSDVESSGSTSTLNNPTATAEKIASLAYQAKLNTSLPSSTKNNNTNSGSTSKTTLQNIPVVDLASKIKEPPPYNNVVLHASDETTDGLKPHIKSLDERKSSITGAGMKPDNLPLISRSQPEQSSQQVDNPTADNLDSEDLGSPEAPQYTQEMIDIITSENRNLKHLVEVQKRKISKLDNLEKEMLKIHEAYQALKEHSEKREILEKSARAKLQTEIVNLQEVNKEFQDRHESIMAQMMSGDTNNIPGLDSILHGEILRKKALITSLAQQNQELMAGKERQDIEAAAQRETLQEQRTHIDVLDSALSNAQSNVLRLEEEVRQKEVYVDRVKQMTRSLEQLQAASEKREAMEKKLRAKLEDELKELRRENNGGNNRSDENEDIEELLQKLSASEEKTIRLESERTQWEQRYLEESAMRQVAIDAASIPKDAKISMLEKSSAESEKKIAEARSDKLKQMSEMQITQRKLSDMELKVKQLETSLAERNAMCKVLQKRAFEKSEEENSLSIPMHEHFSNANQTILHSKQLSQSHIGSPTHSQFSHLGGAISHVPQLSTPVPLTMTGNSPSRHQAGAASDFFDGISTSMSSTARGPLGKLTVHSGRVRSGSPAHTQRSVTPSDMFRTATPTREVLNLTRSVRRDSAPGGVNNSPGDIAGKLSSLSAADSYTTSTFANSGGTLPKMSFEPMKEELSRTLPSKGFTGLSEDKEDETDGSNMKNQIEGDKKPTRDRRDRTDQSNMSLDSSLTMMDDTVNSSILNRSSLMEALKQEKESRPESYWRV